MVVGLEFNFCFQVEVPREVVVDCIVEQCSEEESCCERTVDVAGINVVTKLVGGNQVSCRCFDCEVLNSGDRQVGIDGNVSGSCHRVAPGSLHVRTCDVGSVGKCKSDRQTEGVGSKIVRRGEFRTERDFICDTSLCLEVCFRKFGTPGCCPAIAINRIIVVVCGSTFRVDKVWGHGQSDRIHFKGLAVGCLNQVRSRCFVSVGKVHTEAFKNVFSGEIQVSCVAVSACSNVCISVIKCSKECCIKKVKVCDSYFQSNSVVKVVVGVVCSVVSVCFRNDVCEVDSQRDSFKTKVWREFKGSVSHVVEHVTVPVDIRVVVGQVKQVRCDGDFAERSGFTKDINGKLCCDGGRCRHASRAWRKRHGEITDSTFKVDTFFVQDRFEVASTGDVNFHNVLVGKRCCD
ncbi:Hypothetical Protein CTN_0197 [Thermotoga neapolitana DSM 4359]|uniref:Uncharacterized protein n=1 Tax=Thermotoga neapolitana (strain ATCC 49049 / DSM 4359 / NBRC 107923 / NS-E) TaxID=309803 RepID=B9KBH7_THENN|nr:Hypothetical Protein CTN_0197 [Thermotoga neapolitana DSM 4359]